MGASMVALAFVLCTLVLHIAFRWPVLPHLKQTWSLLSFLGYGVDLLSLTLVLVTLFVILCTPASLLPLSCMTSSLVCSLTCISSLTSRRTSLLVFVFLTAADSMISLVIYLLLWPARSRPVIIWLRNKIFPSPVSTDCEVAQFGGCFQSGPVMAPIFVLFLIHLEERSGLSSP